jgi:hypothetical protein
MHTYPTALGDDRRRKATHGLQHTEEQRRPAGVRLPGALTALVTATAPGLSPNLCVRGAHDPQAQHLL